jgi:hypothetical protein
MHRGAGVSLPGGDEFYESQVSRLAVYGQDEWNVTPAWSVYLGARWEGIRTSTAGNTYSEVKNSSSVLSPVAQTLYKLPGTKGDQVRLAVTRTYKAPGQQQIIPHRFTSVNNSQTEPDSIGNPNLKPELALGIDASYEHYWAEGALLSASVSSRSITDYTRSMVVSFDGARWVSTPTNSGDARTYGLELEAKFPLKAVMDTTTNLDLRASLSRNWSTVDSVPGPDNRLDGQTPAVGDPGRRLQEGRADAGRQLCLQERRLRARLGQPDQLPVGAARPRPVRAVEVQSETAAARGDGEPAGPGYDQPEQLHDGCGHADQPHAESGAPQRAGDDGDEVLRRSRAAHRFRLFLKCFRFKVSTGTHRQILSPESLHDKLIGKLIGNRFRSRIKPLGPRRYLRA